jgi:LCP family protein required for cell wall assembly
MPERPEYKVHRTRPRFLGRRFDPSDDGAALDELRRETPGREPAADGEPRADGARRERDCGDGRGGEPPRVVHGRRRRPHLPLPGKVTPLRFAAGFLLGIVLWLVLSAATFLVSSLTAKGVGDAAVAALDDGSSGLGSPTTTLVLGSDQRPEGTKEPGAAGASQRADSIMLLRSGGGASAKLSIPRDTLVTIPGHGVSKINAAYAFGGAALTIETVKQFLGIEVNHVIEVNFENFPKLIDAMGGIDVTTGCVVSEINGGRRNGGQTLRLRRGTHHLSGDEALVLARTRKNKCRPAEDDRARVRRQQQIVSAMKSRALSPAGFARAPFIAWQTPRAIRTDMSGGTLMAYLVGLGLSGNAPTRVLPATPTTGGSLSVSPADRQAAVRAFEGG